MRHADVIYHSAFQKKDKMTKQEFINTLSAKLYEELPTAAVLDQIRYYEGYIDGGNGQREDGRTGNKMSLGDPAVPCQGDFECAYTGSSLLQVKAMRKVTEVQYKPDDQNHLTGSFTGETGAVPTVHQDPQQDKGFKQSLQDAGADLIGAVSLLFWQQSWSSLAILWFVVKVVSVFLTRLFSY